MDRNRTVKQVVHTAVFYITPADASDHMEMDGVFTELQSLTCSPHFHVTQPHQNSVCFGQNLIVAVPNAITEHQLSPELVLVGTIASLHHDIPSQ